jgi:hypothetical protein
MHRVRLFVLPYGAAPNVAAVEEPGFDIPTMGDDEARAEIRSRLVARGFTVRAVSASAGDAGAAQPYVATVVAPKPEAS